MENPAARALENQFMSSYRMLEVFVDLCPDAVWGSRFYGFPFPVWYQVYHVAHFVDAWLREDYAAEHFLCRSFDPRIPPEFEHGLPEDAFIPRGEMRDYLALLRGKLARVFAALTDGALGAPVFPGRENLTYADVVVCQIRHVMYNLGYLNGILRALDLPEADWWAYNEDE